MTQDPIRRILFICRGSVTDGLGHVMRSRTVALEMARRCSVKLLIVGDNHVDPLMYGRGLHYTILEDESALVYHADEFRPHVIVFDTIQLSEQLFKRLTQSCASVSLSPIFNCLSQVQLLLHRTKYLQDSLNGDGPLQVRAGLEYAIVRENCNPVPSDEYRHNLYHNPFSIVLSMGGADAGNKTLRMLEAIQGVPSQMLIWVLLGEGYGHSYQALVDAVKRDARHEVILAKTSDSMWRIISTCALVVLAGGTVTYEAVRAGIPSINVFEGPEHMFLIRELLEKEVCISAGYPFEDALSVVSANLVHFERNRDELLNMQQRCVDLIDGEGTKRVAAAIEELARGGRVRAAEAKSILLLQR